MGRRNDHTLAGFILFWLPGVTQKLFSDLHRISLFCRGRKIAIWAGHASGEIVVDCNGSGDEHHNDKRHEQVGWQERKKEREDLS